MQIHQLVWCQERHSLSLPNPQSSRRHLHSMPSLMHVTNNLFKLAGYLCSELYEFPADAGKYPNSVTGVVCE